MVEDTAGDVPGTETGEWVGINEAARRLGVTPKAIRNRIDRQQIRWRQAGNHGREVWLPSPDRPGDKAGDSEGDGPGTEALRAELAEARERTARLEGELAELRTSRDREAAALREALEEARGRSRAAEAEAARLAALLEAALRPWWRRWLSGDKARGRSPD